MELTAGTNIMIKGLKNQNDLNGCTGVVFELAHPSHVGFVYVRLHEDNRKIKLKIENVLSLKRGPCYSENSPTKLRAKYNLHEWGYVYDYLCIAEEPGKGEGMQAIKNIPLGMKLLERPEYNEMYHFMPNAGGCRYKSVHYAFKIDKDNNVIFPQEIQALIDRGYDALASTDGQVCLKSARFIGNVCQKGGCKMCGIGTFTMAALMKSSIDDMKNDVSFFNTIGRHFVIDTEMFFSKLQLNEILTVVGFIMEQTKFVHDCVLKADYTKYVWMRIAVWKTNAFTSVMTLRAVIEIIDPLYKEKKKAHLENVRIWLDELKQDHMHDCNERVLRIMELIDRTKLQVGDVDNGQQKLAHSETVVLHPAYITKINGVKNTADEPNCRVVTYFDTNSQYVSLPEDLQSYIVMEKEIKIGHFLCMQYNEGQKINEYGYFKNNDMATLKVHATQNLEIVEIIEICLSRFQNYIDPSVIEHLKYCVRFAEISGRVAKAKFSGRDEVAKILGFLKIFAESV